MRRWERPYSLDIATAFAVLGLAAVAVPATVLVIMYARGELPAPVAIFFAVWLAGGTDGTRVQTPLQRGDLFRPFTFRPELGRLATWPEHYDEILATLRAHHRDAQRRQAVSTGPPAQPPAASRPTTPSVGAGRARTTRDVLSVDQRRDMHALTRQHERGAVSDAEFAAEMAKIRDVD